MFDLNMLRQYNFLIYRKVIYSNLYYLSHEKRCVSWVDFSSVNESICHVPKKIQLNENIHWLLMLFKKDMFSEISAKKTVVFLKKLTAENTVSNEFKNLNNQSIVFTFFSQIKIDFGIEDLLVNRINFQVA